MQDLCALIVLVYFDRPKMVRNALISIKNLEYENWKLAFIDDGSLKTGDSIVNEILEEYLDKITFYNINDTVDKKIEQGGSRHGKFINLAIQRSNSDFVIILCDDDALTSWSLSELNVFFTDHPENMYCYSHIIPFNPFCQWPGPHLGRPKHWLNRFTQPISPSCQVDSSQITYRTLCFKRDGIRYKFPMTTCLDADILSQLEAKYGFCPFSGVVGQYKADFEDQMSKRPVDKQFKPRDIME